MGGCEMYNAKKSAVFLVMLALVCGMFLGCSKKYVSNTSTPTGSVSESLNTNEQTEKQVGTSREETIRVESPKVESHNNLEDDTSKTDSSDLDLWLGTYSFSEYVPEDQNMFYGISISKEGENYYSQISIDGFQTMKRLKAQVLGDENSVDLVFEEYLPDNVFEPYDKGDVLLSFKRENGEIHTYWGKIQPIVESNAESGRVYFTKE
jgi:hypothetical protein